MAENPYPNRTDEPDLQAQTDSSIPPVIEPAESSEPAASAGSSPLPEMESAADAVSAGSPPETESAGAIDSQWIDLPNTVTLPDQQADTGGDSAPDASPQSVPTAVPPVRVADEGTAPGTPQTAPEPVLTPAPEGTPSSAPAPDAVPEPAPRRRFGLGFLTRLGKKEQDLSSAADGEAQPVTATDRARALTNVLLHPAGALLRRLGVHPDQVTLAGTLLVFVASLLIGLSQLQLGALLLLIALPFDALDGAVARAMGRSDKFGAVLDSSADRYADAAIFAGLGYHFAVQNRLELLLLAFAALMGTYAVSYVRARAEGIGVDVKIGLFTRLERLAMILIMLFVPDLLPIGLIILAIGTNFTSVQRLLYVYRVLKQREG